jgi:hypothetical protein
MSDTPDSPVVSPNKVVKKYFLRPEAADYCTARGLTISKTTLAKLAVYGTGPVYRQWGNKCYYTVADLEDWMESRMSPPRHSTSERQQHPAAAE